MEDIGMREYSYTEIGMLAGTAVGGVLSVVGFTFFNHILFLFIVGLGAAAGIYIGKSMDKRANKNVRIESSIQAENEEN